MELQEALRIGYFGSLVGNIGVPVYSEGSVPENATGNFVIIHSFLGDQRFTDRSKVFEVVQTVEVVTESQSPSGYGTANAIASLIEDIINPDDRIDIDITDSGYRIGNTFNIGTSNMFMKSDTKYIYRVIKRYRHLISKEPVTT